MTRPNRPAQTIGWRQCWLVALSLLLAPASFAETLIDIAYGADPRQTLDVYLPDPPRADAPILFMVHGGAWRFGDKGNRAVVANKKAHWLPLGWVLVSINYRMLPNSPPRQQAEDVARALNHVRSNADAWQADKNKIILMGHSAGAHLVALLSTDATLHSQYPALDWSAAVLLDSAAMNVTALMEAPHPRLYDRAFGSDPKNWQRNSPFFHLQAGAKAMLLVCSSHRDNSCAQAQAFAKKAKSLEVTADVLPLDLSHRAINSELGKAGPYTDAVAKFVTRQTERQP